ncbi:MAG: hypothetical protein PXX73_09340 [Sideroxydans sp.]|nr:hypothetical protein [Sideroxydans sp.]
MSEERAVLDFFAQTENLSLALAVADQTDGLREQLNTRFWSQLISQLANTLAPHWRISATEDRNAADSLVGFYCTPLNDQAICLRPMMEQQNLGKGLQIYLGLMWSSAPTPEHLALPAVHALSELMSAQGLKGNANFLAWQWTQLYPRRKDFLLRYQQQPEVAIAEAAALMQKLIFKQQAAITAANQQLAAAPRSMTISLDKLRSKK